VILVPQVNINNTFIDYSDILSVVGEFPICMHLSVR
jgi:hypothetical protein